MEALLLCRSMVRGKFYHQGLDGNLWRIILSYHNKYEYCRRIMNREYFCALTCQRIFHHDSGITYGLLFSHLRYEHHGYASDPLCCTVINVGSYIRVGPDNPANPWYTRPILCRGRQFIVKFWNNRFQISGPFEMEVDLNGLGLSSQVMSINSYHGRRIIRKYRLQAFFEGYLQVRGQDAPVVPPGLHWALEHDIPAHEVDVEIEGNYDALQASIRVLHSSVVIDF